MQSNTDFLGNHTVRKMMLTIITTDKLPEPAHGISGTGNRDDSFIILLDGKQTDEQLTRTFIHEMLHIWHDDFSKQDVNVNVLEWQRHLESDRIYDSLFQITPNS